jgi:hypothetical protein
VYNKKTRCLACFAIKPPAADPNSPENQSASIDKFPFSPFDTSSITAKDSSIIPLPSNVSKLTPPLLPESVFDIEQAAVFLFVGLGSPISLPDFHGIERNGNKPSTNQGVLRVPV